MGDPRNPKRADEPWNLERLRVLEREVKAIAPLVTLSGGWAWHFMAPPHEELKIFHDHKDVDLFVEPERLPRAHPHPLRARLPPHLDPVRCGLGELLPLRAARG